MPEDKMSNPQLHLIADGHEDRIQRTERQQNDLAIKVAENSQQIQFVATEVERGFNRMAERIETCIRPVAEKMNEQSERLMAMGDRMGEQGKSLDKIEDEKRRDAEKWDSWKKWIATAVTGAVAIGLKELVAFIAHHLP